MVRNKPCDQYFPGHDPPDPPGPGDFDSGGGGGPGGDDDPGEGDTGDVVDNTGGGPDDGWGPPIPPKMCEAWICHPQQCTIGLPAWCEKISYSVLWYQDCADNIPGGAYDCEGCCLANCPNLPCGSNIGDKGHPGGPTTGQTSKCKCVVKDGTEGRGVNWSWSVPDGEGGRYECELTEWKQTCMEAGAADDQEDFPPSDQGAVSDQGLRDLLTSQNKTISINKPTVKCSENCPQCKGTTQCCPPLFTSGCVHFPGGPGPSTPGGKPKRQPDLSGTGPTTPGPGGGGGTSTSPGSPTTPGGDPLRCKCQRGNKPNTSQPIVKTFNLPHGTLTCYYHRYKQECESMRDSVDPSGPPEGWHDANDPNGGGTTTGNQNTCDGTGPTAQDCKEKKCPSKWYKTCTFLPFGSSLDSGGSATPGQTGSGDPGTPITGDGAGVSLTGPTPGSSPPLPCVCTRTNTIIETKTQEEGGAVCTYRKYAVACIGGAQGGQGPPSTWSQVDPSDTPWSDETDTGGDNTCAGASPPCNTKNCPDMFVRKCVPKLEDDDGSCEVPGGSGGGGQGECACEPAGWQTAPGDHEDRIIDGQVCRFYMWEATCKKGGPPDSWPPDAGLYGEPSDPPPNPPPGSADQSNCRPSGDDCDGYCPNQWTMLCFGAVEDSDKYIAPGGDNDNGGVGTGLNQGTSAGGGLFDSGGGGPQEGPGSHRGEYGGSIGAGAGGGSTVILGSFRGGCTNPAAINYNPEATLDDGGCIFTTNAVQVVNQHLPGPGCTNPAASNYNPESIFDDGGCIFDFGGEEVNDTVLLADSGGLKEGNEYIAVGGGSHDSEDTRLGTELNFGSYRSEAKLSRVELTKNNPKVKTLTPGIRGFNIDSENRLRLKDSEQDYLKVSPSIIHNTLRGVNSGLFRGVHNNVQREVFSNLVHDSLKTLMGSHNIRSYDTSIKEDITSTRVWDSLNQRFRTTLKNFVTYLGEVVPFKTFGAGILRRALTNDLSTLRNKDVVSLFKTSKMDELVARLSKLNPTEREVISFAIENKLSLDPNNSDNSGRGKYIVENSWARPTELLEKVSVLDRFGNSTSISISDSGNIVGGVYLNNNHAFEVYKVDGTVITIPTENNLENTYTHNNINKGILLNWLGHTDSVILNSESSETLFEFEYDLTQAPKNYYVFKLDKTSTSSTMLASNKNKGLFSKKLVKQVDAVYDYVEDPTSDEFNTYIRHQAMPWKIFYVSERDPILGYLSDESTTNTLSFKNFTLEKLLLELGYPAFSSQLPSYIIIIPTNKFSFNPEYQFSKLQVDGSNFNKRKIIFKPSYNGGLMSTGLTTPLNSEYSFNLGNTDIRGESNTQAIEFNFDPNTPLFKDTVNFTDGIPDSLTEPGVREFYDVVASLDATYDLSSSGFLTTKDVYHRMSPTGFYSLTLTIQNTDILSNILALFGLEWRTILQRDTVTTGIGELKVEGEDLPLVNNIPDPEPPAGLI